MAALLEVTGLTARHGRVEVVHGVDLSVEAGERVALLGPNGAGKTSLLGALSGTVAHGGEVRLDGEPVGRRDPASIARLGIGHVPAGRGTFVDLTVRENLRLGQLHRRGGAPGERRADLDMVLETFPVLAEFATRPAGQLSGGQQQVLALGRALLARPRLLLVDEPSLGLAPLVVRDLFASLATLQQQWGLALLLAEQNARLSLRLAQRAYVLGGGRVVLSGRAEDLGAEQLRDAYLGVRPAPAPAAVPTPPAAVPTPPAAVRGDLP